MLRSLKNPEDAAKLADTRHILCREAEYTQIAQSGEEEAKR